MKNLIKPEILRNTNIVCGATAKFLLIILLLAFLFRILWIFSIPQPPMHQVGDPWEYLILAKNILEGNGLTYAGGGGHLHLLPPEQLIGPTARRTPIYPIFLALIFLFGQKFKAVFLVQAFLDVLVCLMSFIMARELFGNSNHKFGDRCGLLAAAIMAVYLPYYQQACNLLSENLFAFLMTLSTLLLWFSLKYPSWKKFFLLGCFWSLTALTRSTVQFMLPIMMLFVLWNAPKKIFQGKYLLWKERFYFCLALGLGFFLVWLPWGIRNYIHYRTIIPYTTLNGLALLNSSWSPAQMHRGPVIFPPPEIKAKTAGLSEVEADKVLFSEAVQYIKNNPKRYIWHQIKKIPGFWLNLGHGKKNITFLYYLESDRTWTVSITILLFNIPLMILTGLAFVIYPGAWIRPAFPLWFIILYNFGMVIFLVGIVRYALPIIPELAVFSSYSLARFFIPRSDQKNKLKI